MAAQAPKILILDSSESDRLVYRDCLEADYSLQFETSLAGLRHVLRSHKNEFALLITDTRLMDGNFLRVLLDKPELVSIPVIIASSEDKLELLRECYARGAFQCLLKPLRSTELILAIERAITQSTRQAEVQLESFAVKIGHHVSTRRLTAKELQIFSILKASWGRPVSREDIVEQIWPGDSVSTKTLDVHLFNLRRKLAPLGISIQFIPQKGFCLSNEGDELVLSSTRRRPPRLTNGARKQT